MNFRLSLILIGCLLLLSGCLPQKPIERWQIAMQGAYSAAIEKNAAGLVVGSFQHGGSYWRIKTNARQYNWNHRDGYLTEILFSDLSDDGRFAMTANYYNLVLWDTRTGLPVWFWEAPARIEAADLSADGRFAVLGLDSNKAVLFDAQNGGLLREFTHTGPVVAVSVNVRAGLVITGSEDNTAKLWNLRTASLIKTLPFNNQVSIVQLSNNAELAVIVPANEKAEIWNTKTLTRIATLSTAKFRIYSVRFIDNRRLLTGTTHRNIFEFDAMTGKKLNTWQIGTEGKQAFKSAIVLDVAWDGSQLFAMGSNGYLYAF